MSALFNLFYIYDPWLFHFFRMSIFVGLIFFLIIIYRIYKNKFSQKLIIPIDSIIAVLLLIVISAIPMLIHGTKDFSVIIMYCKSLILFLIGISFYNLFYICQENRFITDLKIGITIQAIIGLFALCGIPFVIEFALSTNVILPRFYGSEQEYRLYNITSSAFFQLSIFYLMLFHFLLAYNERNNTIQPIFIFLLLFIGLISGRSFLMLSIISLTVYFKWRYIPALLLFLLLCLFFALNYADNKYVAHALEPLINLIYGKGHISSSTDTLMQKHLFMPTIKQFLFGDGYYYSPQGGYYGSTDSGFLRQILYGGITYVMICFSFTFYFIWRISQNWFNGSWKFIISTLFILTILNIKADTYAFPGIMMIFLMFLSLFGNKGKILMFFNQRKR
ncbi:hypothetical protein A6B43_01575 [Vespertiliibacter pulmonis]|uniref:O-antigen ligase-like membrane protein n=1 Tax=Vespertiliibacter pulmonis TaxID=1443036 RepID=A0A3N4VT90_9PAST|nr:hypothetical protein [Vespertiliibacter pulmonis]QLB20323.1 hypothetical protein A6B43_01575 [Vespertiliibacter pulmonis]RPE86306.1 hypothetical protein EDC46_0702 [Vespertiliibacter pulmonis]